MCSTASRWILAIAIGLLAGCESGTSPTAKLSGKVTVQGRPVRLGSLYMITVDGQRAVSAEVKADGTYSVDNAPVGKVKISLQLPPNLNAQRSISPKIKLPGTYSKERLMSLRGIPATALDPETSKIAFEIKGGDNTFDVELARK